MLADLDLLLTAVFCTADDLLPEKEKNARRIVTDAEVATLCVAQAVMGISSDREFLAVARKRLSDLFPRLPLQPGFHKRRRRLTETIERAKKQAAERRESGDQAARDFDVFLQKVAVPLFRQVANALKSDGYAFTVFTPSGSVRLMSDRNAEDYIELTLDASEISKIQLRYNGTLLL